MNKISTRFFNDFLVRAVWDETRHQWCYSVLDVIGALNEQPDYQKNRNYWKYLKTKLKKQNHELVSLTNQLKMMAAGGKWYLAGYGIRHTPRAGRLSPDVDTPTACRLLARWRRKILRLYALNTPAQT